MSVKLTNISGGQIVCDLKGDKKTLRLDNKKSTTIEDTEMTPHIEHLVQCGLMLSEKVVVEETPATKTTSKRSASKEKEE